MLSLYLFCVGRVDIFKIWLWDLDLDCTIGCVISSAFLFFSDLPLLFPIYITSLLYHWCLPSCFLYHFTLVKLVASEKHNCHLCGQIYNLKLFQYLRDILMVLSLAVKHSVSSKCLCGHEVPRKCLTCLH